MTISKKVILIDGEQFANYMIEYGLSLFVVNTGNIRVAEGNRKRRGEFKKLIVVKRQVLSITNINYRVIY